MTEFWTLYSFEIMSYACVFAIGCLFGYAFRRPVVALPDRGPNGRFLPWKKKETA